MNVLVSVIVPIYKIEDYLEKCVQSIQLQTYQNIEIILVDDGSPDKCGEKCDQFAKEDPRIKVVHKENGGLSDARNSGIDAATGTYIVFVDGDDYIHEDYIKKLYNALTRNEADVAVCSFSLVDDDKITQVENVSETDLVITGHELLSRVLTDTGYKYVVAWNKLYKRELFVKHHFAKGKLYEDEYINYELFWDVEKVALVSESLYFYVQRVGSIQGSGMTWDRLLTKQEIHKNRISFYRNKGAEDLMRRSSQMYCNWLVSISFVNKDILDEKKNRILQEEFREYCHNVAATKGEKIQNFIAKRNIKFAGMLKAKYKN